MLIRPCVQNFPGNNSGLSPSGYSLHPRESGPKFVQEPGGVTTSPTLLGPVLVWSQQNYLRLLLIVRYSGAPRAAALATLPKGKAAWKWENEWVCKPTLNLSIYEIVCSVFCQKWMSYWNKHIWTETCVFVKIS